ncbi:uncharacterized protein LOC141684826 isoform X2 [Apium graveolens]|uniref:uncharacterized protein LOC141684826 isoform X2 n=1 Tax=Apium graveolens TaxID=4045 RepID=UPI003D7ACE1E
MAISSGFGFSCRPNLHFCHCFRKVRFGSVADVIDEPDTFFKGYSNRNFDSVSSFNDGGFDDGNKAPVWKRFTSKELGITNGLIPRPTRLVLEGLKRKGYKVYLVGGCVRDLILKQKPKDFDVLTSAELKEVARTFSQCLTVGRRFPICHVTVDGTIVEVSSFSTSVRSGRAVRFDVERPLGYEKEDYIRWRNCLERDFTINSLMLDPYAKIVYDYLGGVEDIRRAKVQTVKPSNISLSEDSARILRGIRIASRLGFGFTRETALGVINLSFSVLRLDKGRLLMEVNYMLAYGSAESSLRLLWKYGLLDILLPFQAAHFVRSGFRRRDKRSNMLLCLFSHMDKFLAPDMPCHSSLWVAILAFHKALSDEPREPAVVAAYSLTVYFGGDMSEALKIAREISRPHDADFNELLEPCTLDHEELKEEVLHFDMAVRRALSEMTDEYHVSKAMSGFPKAPKSDLVFISLQLYLRVCKIFECVKEGKQVNIVAKQGSNIDNELLTLGSLEEVRHVFARVVFDTVYPISTSLQ